MSEIRRLILEAGYPETLLDLEDGVADALREQGLRAVRIPAYFDENGNPRLGVL